MLTQTKRSVYHRAVRHTCETATTEAAADLSAFIARGRQQHPGCRTVELIAHLQALIIRKTYSSCPRRGRKNYAFPSVSSLFAN